MLAFCALALINRDAPLLRSMSRAAATSIDPVPVLTRVRTRAIVPGGSIVPNGVGAR